MLVHNMTLVSFRLPHKTLSNLREFLGNVRPRRKKNHRGEWRKSPQESRAILYMSRKYGERGLKSVENIKIKAAVKLYCNADPTMAAVRLFEE